MSRGKAYNIWKSRSKYVSRLKKHMYYWLVEDGEKVNRFGYFIKNWRKAKSWKELDEKGGNIKRLKKTVSQGKTTWEKVDCRKEIKKRRKDDKNSIDEELNNG